MGKIKQPVLKWTPVEITESLLSGGVEGLIGIEELTDYQLENNELELVPKTGRTPSKHPTSLKLKTKSRSIKKPNVTKIKSKNKKQKPDLKIGLPQSETGMKNFATETVNSGSTSCDCEEQENVANSSIKTKHDGLIPWTSLYVPIPVAKALVEQGFKTPTEIQRLTIPPAIKGRRDILGAAETGSGKTLAFGIPIIDGILKYIEKDSNGESAAEDDSSSESDKEDTENEGMGCVKVVNLGMQKGNAQSIDHKLWALILTPTRELAVQVKDHLVAALKYTPIKVVGLVGGMSMEKQQRLLKRHPQIVVATPGRLWELISQGEPHFNNIEDIRYLAIDETDRMTEVNHFPELRSLLERINIDPEKQKLRQNFVFSATLTLVHDIPLHTKLKNKKKKKKSVMLSSNDKLKKFINLLGITDPKVVDVTKKTGMAELLTETSIVCSLEQKDYYLAYFLERHCGRTLVFCNSISCVRRLASLMGLLQLRPLPLHANMLQKQRLKNLERFRDSPDGLLLATDVAARGLDIPNVEHVIHYQVPRTSEVYVHRSGRTARANHEGLTLLLVETGEQGRYLRLMKTLHREKELPRFPIVSSLMDAVKQRVNLARDIDKMQLEFKKATSKVSWVERAAQEMDLLLDEDEIPEKVTDRATAVIKRQIASKQKQLKALLKQSLRPRGFSYKYPSLNVQQTVNTAAASFKSSQTAIEVLKSAFTDEDKKRKTASKPFKTKKKKKTVASSNNN